ncbi:MAG: dienelactone hydrolase family protein [Anaerolineae bacterium]|nr:dienelactone hydrolase family protein [Anaerolineae bacterium]
MTQEMIPLAVADGEAQAYLARPAQEGPGVLLLHAWWGLNPFFKSLCDRLAEAGFVALAPDLCQGRVATTIDEAEALQSNGDDALQEQTVAAAADYLLGLPGRSGGKIGVIGFSMGAWWSVNLALERPEEVGAVVLYYGAVPAPYTDYNKHSAAFLGHFGELDEWEPLDTVREMEQAMHAAGREATIHVYPEVGHWFVEEDRPDVYVPDAAEVSWERTIGFLREQLR